MPGNARTNMRTITNHERGVIITRSPALVAFSTLAFLAIVRAGRSDEASPEPPPVELEVIFEVAS